MVKEQILVISQEAKTTVQPPTAELEEVQVKNIEDLLPTRNERVVLIINTTKFSYEGYRNFW